jgi:hypothetical protein
MKYLSKIILFFAFISTLMVACNKESALPTYSIGNAAVLSSSKATIAVAPADSSATAVTLSWTDPMYATGASTVKYVLEIDSTGRNFAKPVSYTLTGVMSKSLTGKELNDILLGFGFKFNVAYGIDLRVTSSYANNNDKKVSNTIKLTATPYKVPPKVDLPAGGRLFIVGGASTFGWSNSSTIDPAEELARLDETTWAGVFDLSANSEFLILPIKGAWAEKYATPSNGAPGIQDGGDFKFYTNGGDNFKSPSAAGKYLLTFDFQRGKFTIVPFTGPDLATNLFIVGNGTAGGWNNPVPVPSQQFTRLNSSQFEMSSLALNGGNEYLLLPENGNWGKKYAILDNSVPGADVAGSFQYYTNGGSNFKVPTVSGNYKIEINFATGKYKLTKL